jgi:hypothetical protein
MGGVERRLGILLLGALLTFGNARWKARMFQPKVSLALGMQEDVPVKFTRRQHRL